MKTPETLLAVDEALASGRPDAADPVARELQEIALALRADAPEPDPGFARELDERVARRFERPLRARMSIPRRRFVLSGAALIAVIAAVGAVAGLTGGGDQRSSPPAIETPNELAQQEAPKPGPLQAGANTRALRDAGARRVEHTAQLKLAAPPGDLDHVADQVVGVTDRHRGVVLNSSVSTGADSGHGGSFSLRVPTTELTGTLRDLSRLGEVRERSQFEQDVTRNYSTLADRLASARLERRGIERRLTHATSTAEADRLRARLDSLAQEIHRVRDELGRLRVRTDYTRLSVTLVARARGASPIGGAGDALNGSLRALVHAVAVTLRIVAAVLPFALLGALAWAATGAVRRRRREAVLS